MTLPDNTRVLIVGGGPTGLTLANLLGSEGVDTVLIERNPGCVPEPRAIGIDGESLRTLQACGLIDTVLPTLQEGFVAEYINGAGDALFAVDLTHRPYGFCLQNSFDQPTLERQLLAGLGRFDCVKVFHETALDSFEQDQTGVTVHLETSSGEPGRLRADYLVACDGGRSGIRRSLGIDMQGNRLPQKWLVIDTVDKHLTGQPECRFYCDPARPAMTLLRPGGERRWEWMLMDDESDEEMLADGRIRELLAAHTDPEAIEIYRKCVYGFSAVVAQRFYVGRVFLAGDAAHMTPPFAGQGLNAGLRDARNLAWKLARVVNGSLPGTLLSSYHNERHDAAREMVEMAVMLGDQIQPTDPAAAAERDANFAALNRDPAAAKAFSDDLTTPLRDVSMSGGWIGEDDCAGRLLPQPEVAMGDDRRRLDDTLGHGFTAFKPAREDLPAATAGHPLWLALKPDLHTLPLELEDFAQLGPGEVLLVRPDRFVMAKLASGAGALVQLDRLASLLTSAGAAVLQPQWASGGG